MTWLALSTSPCGVFAADARERQRAPAARARRRARAGRVGIVGAGGDLEAALGFPDPHVPLDGHRLHGDCVLAEDDALGYDVECRGSRDGSCGDADGEPPGCGRACQTLLATSCDAV